MIQLSPGRTFIIVNMVRKRLLYICPLLLMLVVLVEAFTGLSCSRSQRQSDILSDAERVVPTNPDAALSLINEIEPSDIKTDSLRALYYLVKTSAHRGNESSMASDSLIRFSFEYYKNCDRKRFAQSAALYALHRFWIGDAHGALGLLDSMASLKDIPDSLMVGLLQARIEVGGAGLDCEGNIASIRRLQELDKDLMHWLEYKYLVCENYQFAGCRGEALAVIEELIEYARANHLESALYEYEYEKIGILEEVGRYEESNMLVDYFLEHDLWGEKISWGENLSVVHLSYNWKNWQFGAGVLMPFGKYDQGSKMLSKWNTNEQHMRIDMCMPYISIGYNL